MQWSKALALSIIASLVFSIAVFAAPLEHEGSLEFYWNKDSQLTHSEWAKLKYDLRKDFGHGFSAGLSVAVSPSDTGGVLSHEWDGWANMDFGHTFVNLSSWQEFTGANFIMADAGRLPGGPGVVVDFKQLDNVFIQGHIGNFWDSAKNDRNGGMVYTYGAKATYDGGNYQVGFGLQGHRPENKDVLMGGFVFGSTTLAEGLTVELEAGYRTDLEDWRLFVDNEEEHWYIGEYQSGKAFTAQVNYEKGTLRAGALLAYKDPFFLMKKWDHPETARDYYFMNEWNGFLVGLNVEEEVIPYLTLKGQLDVLLGVEDNRHESNTGKFEEIAPIGFSVNASYRATLGSTVSGWYSQYDQSQLVGVGLDTWDWSLKGEYDIPSKTFSAEAEYTFVEDFTGVAKVKKPVDGDFWYGLELKIKL